MEPQKGAPPGGMSGGNGHGRFVDGKIWSENRKVVENAMMNCLSLVDRSTACQKLQKVPLPTLGRLAAPLGSLHPLPPSKPPICWRRPRSLYCDGSVAELFVLRGQPWLDAIPFGCWSVGAITGVLPVFNSWKRTSCCSRGPDLAHVFLRMDYQQRSASSAHSCRHRKSCCCRSYRLQAAAWHQSPVFCELQTLLLRELDQVQHEPSNSSNASMRCCDAT